MANTINKNDLKHCIIGAIIGGLITGIGALLIRKSKDKNEMNIGNIIVYEDDFENNQLYLEIGMSLDELKVLKHGKFRIIYDKDRFKKKNKVVYAKS